MDKVNNIPWVEKYRPKSLGQIKSHEKIIHGIRKYIQKDSIPNCIFYGPSGIGKTSTILAFIKEHYGKDSEIMTININGSDDKGIDVIRELIKSFVLKTNFDSLTEKKRKHKIILIDEADSLTYDAQFSLGSVIESSVESARFCLTCNLSYKIIGALQSRCISYRFQPIDELKHLEHLKNICCKENVKITDKTLKHLVTNSNGDMRKSLNTLQCLAYTFKNSVINIEKLYKSICCPTPKEKKELVNTIINNNFRTNFQIVKKLIEDNSYSLLDILYILFDYIVICDKEQDYKLNIIEKFSEIEINLSKTFDTDIQLAAIISCVSI